MNQAVPQYRAYLHLSLPAQVVSMSRYRGPRLRIVRRLGELPGLTQKTPQKQAPPGQHGATTKKPTQYGVRLMEKQKLRYNYGVTEHQLINYVKKARYVAVDSSSQLLGPAMFELEWSSMAYFFAALLILAAYLSHKGSLPFSLRCNC